MTTPRLPRELKWERYREQNDAKGFPWCDTCKMPAIRTEGFGILHTTPEWPNGLPLNLDISGHEVTISEWWNKALEQRS